MRADIGVYGLAVMGSNLARNFAGKGIRVAIHNRSSDRSNSLAQQHSECNFIVAKDDKDFIDSLSSPRTVLLMVKAGSIVDEVIARLSTFMQPGDVIIDGGNSLYTDTIRREEELKARGLHFIGLGVSGGEVGALEGPSLMPGGSDYAYSIVGPMLEKIAARANGEPCVAHIGHNGAGHFVKMVHNGIEYADMQIIAESYDLLRRGLGLSPTRISDIFREWNSGELESYLVGVTADILSHRDKRTGKPFVDIVLDQAGAKGTGAWTAQNALDLGVPAGSVSEAVFARSLSSDEQRCQVQQKLSRSQASSHEAPLKEAEFIDAVRNALYLAKILAYSQGFRIISVAAAKHDWGIDLSACARIWRAGCIIRAVFLDKVAHEYSKNPDLTSLMCSPGFSDELVGRLRFLREVVASAARLAIPAPVFSSLLSYIDALASDRLPACLIQAQRDDFGAHTYRRVDVPGIFHTLWSSDLSEVPA
ncbi:MAG: NADP-dependent phosphogluconate dehydrogenase [Tropheryma whipplei]|uniref:6-phosphogluconate dehydrogenase, decarboxylating n=1 Tax=Tropheryma whipplei (strain Twist) TaxID=203267 RepID=Q83G38_TROWT|nr:NADP-dependent phosphogluconate dehydrogenase [Tropheryma whipplei]AAO44589.1 6-phosphogluconate dehydrogenase [Tropheryma whipplei str. Twist]MCO8182987.1 NADP-dependent phosphogluconate dehydrogenase [Tropheryma whipplei]MCO8190014.1 NADP-dependent phosphogluconate dehydrogenase [Tropheryma whipplei]CAD66946.1 6-phosphogluconate dehydrogenase, decarboxylating [Tropheryma whipplei TW08/27]